MAFTKFEYKNKKQVGAVILIHVFIIISNVLRNY